MEKMQGENVFEFSNIGDCIKTAFKYAENAEITVSIKKEIREDGREWLDTSVFMKSADEQLCDKCGNSKRGLCAPFSIALIPGFEIDNIFEKGMLSAIRILTAAYYKKHVLKIDLRDVNSRCVLKKDGLYVNDKLIEK